jgi:MSHA pilin protein MshA
MTKNQQGFTLIELIIVIVILGILAATASPKFLDFTSEAKVSTVQGLSASLKSASNIVYSKALVQGKASSASANTTNPTVAVVYGYPKGTITDLKTILDIDVLAADATNAVTANWEAREATGSIRIFPSGEYDAAASGDDKACYVEYTQATDTATATVSAETSEC